MVFALENFDFVELNKLMKILNWVESGGQANTLITEGEVKVNGVVETRKRKKLRRGDRVVFMEQEVNIV